MHSKIYFLFTLLFCLISFQDFSQKTLYNNARLGVIDNNTQIFERKFNEKNEIVKTLAKKLNIEIRRKLSDGRLIELKGINEINEPIFIISENNLQAGQTTHTNSIYKGGNLGLDITGSSATINGRLGIWDGGKVLVSHEEFGNRVTQMDNTSQSAAHSTHVAGTMVASGINAISRGMAPTAQLKAWDYNNDDAEMSAASKELLVSNHSYGQVAGWVYNDSRQGNQKWEWYGNTQISNYEDYKFGFYDSQSQTWDKIAYDAPNYLIVKSAGNKRNETGPEISKTDTTKTVEKYYLGSSSDTSVVARSRNNNYDILPTYSVAKNILTVGAVSIIPNGPNLASDIKISSFSSWGPTDDGRIKPDIVGAGVNLFSTSDLSPKSYSFLSGTSMASPQVSGSIFLLQELYGQFNNAKMMRSSTLKGLILHSADDAGRPGPDYTYGWGLLNIEKAAKILVNKDKTHFLEELSLAQNGSFTKKIIANGKDPIVATICWTDPEATPTTATSTNLNSRIPKLINDLDITISDGRSTFQAWILDPNKPANNASKGDNFRDNVEQVYIANPVPGKEYTIKISHKSILSKGLQDFALIISGSGGAAYCTSTPTSMEDTKIEKITINGNIYNAPNGCTNYSDNTGIKLEVSPNQILDIELNTGSCGVLKDKAYAIFADWNIDGDFEDEGENLVPALAISNLNAFKHLIKVPMDITPGGNTRLRVVTSESATITACGSYSKGETMDFLLSYIYPKVDLAITKLLFPDENICRNTSIDNVNIELNNKGTEIIKNGDFNVKIFENELVIANQKAALLSAIPGLTNSRITIPINLTFKADAKYRFELSANISNDENIENNLVTVERSVIKEQNSEVAKVVNCDNGSLTTLSSEGKGAAFWYDAEIGGNLIAIGNKANIKKPVIPSLFYVSQNDLQGSLGPITKKQYAGGTYSGNFGPKPLISTKAPIMLESARLYIGHSGKITFTVERISDLTPMSTVTLDVTATRDSKIGNASNGQQMDDPNDPGAIYNLGLEIPEAGDYQISIEYEDDASIFRSNQGVSGFPFSLQNVVTISGSSFNGGVLKEAWYYFYNLKIKSLGCPSAKRVLATPANANGVVSSISSDGGTSICPNQSITLTTTNSQNIQYQWFKDSTAIADANKNTLLVSQKGNYFVQLSENGICPTASNSLSITAKSPAAPIITATANLLTSSPAENYQWLLARVPIEGANKQEFTAFKTGSYSIQGVVDGCTVQSFEIYLIILADETLPAETDLLLFPNPAFDKFTIKNLKSKTIKYQIFNNLGQKIQESELQNNPDNPPSVSISQLTPNQYFIRMEADKKVYLKKFIKQ
ncbi:MAG: S8 family serine peptidase [Bacteroidota bacterium]